jgi:hypothetical protein
LRLVLAEYVRHYNGRRPHRARELRPPQPTHPVPDLNYEQIKRFAVAPGLVLGLAEAAPRVRRHMGEIIAELEPELVHMVKAVVDDLPTPRYQPQSLSRPSWLLRAAADRS